MHQYYQHSLGMNDNFQEIIHQTKASLQQRVASSIIDAWGLLSTGTVECTPCAVGNFAAGPGNYPGHKFQ